MKKLTLFLCFIVVCGPACIAAESGMHGFSDQNAAAQRAVEARFDTFLKAENLREWMQRLTAKPHHTGSPYAKENVEFMAGLFRSWGYDTRIEEFKVLFPTPKTILLEMESPFRYRAALKEPAIPDDRTSGQPGELPIYNAFSADGDVTGDLIYANYGLEEDYDELKMRGIDVRGKIVITRYGGGWRGLKPKIAAKKGAIGCIIYSDPMGDGYYHGEVYPKGGWRNEDSAQRGSVMDFTDHNGDPLTPFIPATENAKRIRREQSNNIAKIPVLPISYKDALPLLRALGGDVAPEEWRGSLPIPYRTGPGPARVHLKLEFSWDLVSAYDVIARMEGSEFPDQWIIRGSHHDAWVYGATDPVSSMVAILEEARAVAELAKAGFRPKRTLIYAAWDGEEQGLLGSTEWVEAHRDELRAKTVAYLNTDSNAQGFLFFEGSSSLEKLLNEVAADVKDPREPISIKERARAFRIMSGSPRDVTEARERDDLRMPAPGSGSDFSPFLQHIGIPILELGFGGEEEYGVYHSIYDSFDHYIRFVDPSFAYGITLAKTGGRCMLRLANADVLPFEFNAFAETISGQISQLQGFIEQIRSDAEEKNKNIQQAVYKAYFDPRKGFVLPELEKPVPEINFTPLVDAAKTLEKKAAAYHRALGENKPDANGLRKLNEILLLAERALTSEGGLPGRKWFKHQINSPAVNAGYRARAMPSIREAIRLKDWKLVEEQIVVVAQAVERFSNALAKATATWNLTQGKDSTQSRNAKQNTDFFAASHGEPRSRVKKMDLKTCRPEGVSEDLLCGEWSVLEDRAKPDGRRIAIHVTVLPALNADKKGDPLFELYGSEFAELYSTTLKSYRRDRDVVLIDLRGTGKSNPLSCERSNVGLQSFLDSYFTAAYVQACASALSGKADLSMYTTSHAMEDVDEVREALGYDRIHLIGTSYTSRATLEYIRRYEPHVRSAILRAVVPYNANIPVHHATHAQRAIEILFTDCSRDSACNAAFPNLRREWTALLERLNTMPAIVVYRLKSGEEAPLTIRRDIFAEYIRLQLYSPASSRKIPYVIHQAYIANFHPFLKLVIPENSAGAWDNFDGSYLSASCNENIVDETEATALNAKTDFGNHRLNEHLRACANWPHHPKSLQPAEAKTPILILSGEKDPVTPPELARDVERVFENSRFVLIPEGSHTNMGLSHQECVIDMIVEFLKSGNVVNASCVSQMQPPAFQIEEAK